MPSPLFLDGNHFTGPEWIHYQLMHRYEMITCPYCDQEYPARLLEGVPGHAEIGTHDDRRDANFDCEGSLKTYPIEREQKRLL